MSRMIIVAALGLAMLALVLVSQYQNGPDYVSGVIEADEIRLGSRVGGRIEKVHVTEGEVVQSGQPLIEFQPYDLLEREQQARDQLGEREAFLRKLEAGNRAEEVAQAKTRYDEALAHLSLVQEGPRQQEIRAAETRLDVAEANFKLAKREYDRQTNLFETGAVSKSEYDAAIERFESADATVRMRQSELAILNTGSREQEIQIAQAEAENLRLAWEIAKQGFRIEEIEQARAARDAAHAALAAIQKQKSELTLTAPAAGTVDSLDLQPGDIVAPNAPVMTLLSKNDLRIRAYIPQRLMQVQIGKKLRVTIDSLPDQDFEGVVTFISQQAEFTPSNVQTPDDRAKQVYRIRVTLQDPQGQLRPGMTANVWLESDSAK